MFEPIVEINGEKYVLWYFIDDYKIPECINATRLKDYEKLKKEYPDEIEEFPLFACIFEIKYNDFKEMLEDVSGE